MNQLVITDFIVALIPVILLIIGLGILKMPAYLVCGFSFIITTVISILYFSMSLRNAIQASQEGIMIAVFPILWVILSALFVYNITVETGNMLKIEAMLSKLSPDRRIQGLIIAFSFGGFLEAVSGFGTPVAIPAGILVSLGFNPLLAAVVCLVANTVPVAFGVLGIPIITLAQLTNLSLQKLSLYAVIQLIPFAILLPLILVFLITGSVKKIKGVIGISLAGGIAFCIGQTLMAYFTGPELAAVVGSIASLITIVLMSILFPVKNIYRFTGESPAVQSNYESFRASEYLKAWSPYILIMLLAISVKFIPDLNFLYKYPFVVRKQFYFGNGGKPIDFQLIVSSGTLLFLSAIIGGLIQRATLATLYKTFFKTIKQIKNTSLTVISIVALSKVMGYGGMIGAIANTLALVSGRFYPLIAPLIGALGTFITGSNTSSNILFGSLQEQTALKLGMNAEWLASSNASGATIGKMISPQSIAIVTSVTNLGNEESKILRKTFKYFIVFIVIMGVYIFVGNSIIDKLISLFI